MKDSLATKRAKKDKMKKQNYENATETREEKNETLRVWGTFDDLERYTSDYYFEIHGIWVHTNSDTKSDVAENHECAQSKHTDKFCSHRSKAELYKELTKLRHVELSETFLSFSTTVESNQGRIYINEK